MSVAAPDHDNRTRHEPADRRVADLLAVLDISRRLAAAVELQPLLEDVQRATLAVLDCERASVFLLDTAANELVSRVATDSAPIRFPADRGLAGEALRAGRVINVPDAHADPRFNRDVDRDTGFRTRSLLSCPLRGWDDAPLGVLQALNKRGESFDAWDETLATALAAQAGLAVQRQLLLERRAQAVRYERELDIARQIQRALLPRRAPNVPGFEVAGWSEAAEQTGGDVYDFLVLDDGSLAVTVADASGHGIGPALVIAQYRAAVRAAWAREVTPERVAVEVEALLGDDMPEERFITAFFARLEPDSARLRYVSAGHGPVLTYRARTGEVAELPSHGFPLGLAPGLPFDGPGEFLFEPGDLMVIFTDGFPDWADPADARFGVDRLAAGLRQHHHLPAPELIRVLQDAARDFARPLPQGDDITAVVLKRR